MVLLFFPLAWTSVCTKEMCSIRDGYAEYAKLNAQVLGISVDSAFALKAWAKERLAAYKYPRHVVVAAELRKSATGKILKRSIPLEELFRT